MTPAELRTLVDRATAGTERPSDTGLSHAEYAEAILIAALGRPVSPHRDAREYEPGETVSFHDQPHTVLTAEKIKGKWKLRILPGVRPVSEILAFLTPPADGGFHFTPGVTVFPTELDA